MMILNKKLVLEKDMTRCSDRVFNLFFLFCGIIVLSFLNFSICIAQGTGGIKRQDNFEDPVDLSQIRKEIEKSRNDSKSSSSQASLQSELQKLMAAEAELLSKLSSVSNQSSSEVTGEVTDNKNVKLEAAILESNASDQSSIDKAIDTLTEKKQDDKSQKSEVILETGSKAENGSTETYLQNIPSEKLESFKVSGPQDLQMRQKALEQELRIEKLEKENMALKQEAEKAKREASKISKELLEARNRLIISESQIERLSSIIEERKHKTSFSSSTTYNGITAMQLQSDTEAKQRVTTEGANQLSQSQTQQGSKRIVTRKSDEVPVVTVIADKAYLRTGPGKDNSPLMSISKGKKLAVETRNGEWLRVIAPTGVRAWISEDVVSFQPSPK